MAILNRQNLRQFISKWILLIGFMIFAKPTFAGISGDAAIDLELAAAQYDYIAGGSGGAIDRGSNTLNCNSASAPPMVESNCPNDATYTPAAATGGYQAWGVGVKAVNFVTEELECSLEITAVWVDGEWEYIWTIICSPGVTANPKGTNGLALAAVRWGETIDSTTSAYGPVPPGPTSVFAFHENLLPCDAVSGLGCSNPQNSSYVSDSGYEIDITIEDPLCDPPGLWRTGTQLDFSQYGCYSYLQYDQTNTLPENYKDTTFGDSQDKLTIGFGSASGIEIDPGTTYFARQFFRSKLQPVMSDKEAVHTGQITTKLTGCLLAPEFCYFTVDTASVGGPFDTFSMSPIR